MDRVVDEVMETYGTLTIFDLAWISQRDGGVWKRVYVPDANAVITPAVIMTSTDGFTENIREGTLAECIERVRRTWPNALRMLEDS